MRQRLLPLLPTLTAGSLASRCLGNLPVLGRPAPATGPGPEGSSSSKADGTLRPALARNIVWLHGSAKKVIVKNRTCPRRERAAITTPGCPWWRQGAGCLWPERGLFGLLSRAHPEPALPLWALHTYSPGGQAGLSTGGLPYSRADDLAVLPAASSLTAHLLVISLLISTSSRR